MEVRIGDLGKIGCEVAMERSELPERTFLCCYSYLLKVVNTLN